MGILTDHADKLRQRISDHLADPVTYPGPMITCEMMLEILDRLDALEAEREA